MLVSSIFLIGVCSDNNILKYAIPPSGALKLTVKVSPALRVMSSFGIIFIIAGSIGFTSKALIAASSAAKAAFTCSCVVSAFSFTAIASINTA